MYYPQGPLAYVPHPGETLREKLDELGMPIKEFAQRCIKPIPTIHHVLNGQSSITPDMAIAFEKVLQIPAHLWLNMQASYDEYIARKRHDDDVLADKPWADCFPLQEMTEKGLLSCPADSTPRQRIQALLSYFGIVRASAWRKCYTTYNPILDTTRTYALTAWLRHADNQAEMAHDLHPFSHSKLKELLPDIKKLAHTGNSHFWNSLTDICRAAGILVILTPHLSQANILGASRWLRGIPVLQLSDCPRRYDQFWFSFFHLLGHLLLHGKRDSFIEGLTFPTQQKQEQAVDAFAERCLLPGTIRRKLRTNSYSEQALAALCRREHVHLAFVVGHLQHIHLLCPANLAQDIPIISPPNGK